MAVAAIFMPQLASASLRRSWGAGGWRAAAWPPFLALACPSALSSNSGIAGSRKYHQALRLESPTGNEVPMRHQHEDGQGARH